MKIMWFCIPAFGHTNPTIEVVRELVHRGHHIRYYSFNDFKEKIEDTGATYIECDSYLPPVDKRTEKQLREVNTTEMSINAFKTTINLDSKLSQDINDYQPDLIVSDAVCFWGKLIALKYNIPFICSTTTFAFNEYSSKYMKYSAKEMFRMISGVPKMNKALKTLEPLGYHVKSALDIVQNKNDTYTIVYTSKKFQPFSETFDDNHYCFVGPSVKDYPIRNKDKKLIYISLGTVINNHPDFYKKCIDALANEGVEVLISCGRAFDKTILNPLPDNVRVEHYVNQMEVLSKASLFITHCGMNSASEGLYMGVPELLFPLTGEQQAVARRVNELGAGIILDKKNLSHLKETIINALNNQELLNNALSMREDFINCSGYKGAADFIEQINKNNQD